MGRLGASETGFSFLGLPGFRFSLVQVARSSFTSSSITEGSVWIQCLSLSFGFPLLGQTLNLSLSFSSFCYCRGIQKIARGVPLPGISPIPANVTFPMLFLLQLWYLTPVTTIIASPVGQKLYW